MAEILKIIQSFQDKPKYTLEELDYYSVVIILRSKEDYLKFYNEIGYKFEEWFTKETWDYYIHHVVKAPQYNGILCIGTVYDEETPEDSYMEPGSWNYYDSLEGIMFLEYNELIIVQEE